MAEAAEVAADGGDTGHGPMGDTDYGRTVASSAGGSGRGGSDDGQRVDDTGNRDDDAGTGGEGTAGTAGNTGRSGAHRPSHGSRRRSQTEKP